MKKQPLKFATLAALAVMAAPAASLHALPPLTVGPAPRAGAVVAEYKTREDIASFITSIKGASADTSATAAGAKNAVKLVGLYKEIPAVLKAVSELKVDPSAEAQKAFDDALSAHRKSPCSFLLFIAAATLEIDRETQREKIFKEVTDAAKPIPDAIEAFANGFAKPLSGDYLVPAKVKLLPSSALGNKGASSTEAYATEFAKTLPTLAVAKTNAGKVLPAASDQQTVATAYTTYGCGTPPDFSKADAAVKKLGATATKLDGDLKDLFQAYADHIPTRLLAIEGLVADVHRNRTKFKGPALDYQEVERGVAGALGSIVAAWNVYNEGNGNGPTNIEAQRIGRQLPGYQVAIQGIELALVPLSRRENHRVELYYFRDLQRLLTALRPDVQNNPFATPTADLADLRNKILEGDYARDSELANLSDLQQKLLDQRARATALKEKATEAKKAASAAEERARESERKLIRLETNQSRAKERRELAETAVAGAKETATKHANDPVLTPEQKAELAIQDEQAIKAAERTLTRARELERQAEEAVELEKQQNKTILEDKTKADTALTEAQAAVKANADAQAESEKAIRDSAVKIASIRANSAQLVQQDNRVFAELRDNQPYMFAPAKPDGVTPLERVQFIGLKDKQRMILSGDRVDLVLVEDLISQFDRPAPQAKLILRVLEVGVIHDQDGIGARNYNRAFDEIRDILADVREKTTAVGTLLRDCINERVRLAEATAASPIVAPTVSISPTDATLLRRFAIYEPDVLRSLGAPGIFSTEEEVAFAVRNIPDPSRTTTLGEALLVLMLTNHAEQRQIADDFRKRAQTYLSKFKPFPGQDNSRLNFAGSRRVMGIDEFGSTRFGLSPQQKELVAAIQRRTVECIVPEMRETGIRIDELQDFSQVNQIVAKNKADQAELDGLHRSLKTRYGYLNDQFALNGDHLDRFFVAPRHENDAYFSFVSQFPVSEVNARIAAADKMLKDIIERIEDDVNRVIVDPAMAEIREKLRKGRLEVGLLTTTEVLSTNRFPARVDAGASAQVAVGSQYDVLSAAQQLASLAAASNGATAVNILRQLKSDANEPSREIYGIGTGGLFNVTPYFDPSGQSLRFTFDYFTANRVREPNGTTNPQLPRIERHSINTEVELSSFELRYISEFTSNSKLGTARHQWGGIPILNDIPILKELPIIGWFVRKEGRAAVSQHSLVFGQTTVYPTINDMLTLLTPLSSRVKLGGK